MAMHTDGGGVFRDFVAHDECAVPLVICQGIARQELSQSMSHLLFMINWKEQDV